MLIRDFSTMNNTKGLLAQINFKENIEKHFEAKVMNQYKQNGKK